MALYEDDRLQRLFFPNWILDDRANNWLWFVLRDYRAKLNIDDSGTSEMWNSMAEHIEKQGIINDIIIHRDGKLVPEHDLNWIEKSGRQPSWLLNEYLMSHRDRYTPARPPTFTAREDLIALLDS